jgi:hypothetical protein
MKRLLSLAALCLATLAAAEDAPERRSWTYLVGAGGGYEAGNGLHLGLGRGKWLGVLGLGLLYDDQIAEFKYSTGLRGILALYSGRVNDTYAWTGAAVHGHYRKRDQASLAAAGAGLGVSLHFGLPFHLNLDSGWDAFYDGNTGFGEVQYGPTFNGDLVYEW